PGRASAGRPPALVRDTAGRLPGPRAPAALWCTRRARSDAPPRCAVGAAARPRDPATRRPRARRARSRLSVAMQSSAYVTALPAIGVTDATGAVDSGASASPAAWEHPERIRARLEPGSNAPRVFHHEAGR